MVRLDSGALAVAVVGAGIQGTTIALELASRGCRVDVFEAEERPFTRASVVGEGKLHCGFLYALDGSGRTAPVMRAGSAVFFDLVAKWAGTPIPESAISRPFVYAVHRSSLIGAEEVATHLKGVAAEIESSGSHRRYPRSARSPWVRQWSVAETMAVFSDEIVAAHETGEVAVDPNVVASLLVEALGAHPAIDVRTGHHVDGVEGLPGSLFVRVGEERIGPYAHVVNAAWAGRLVLDASRGLIPDRPWLFRHKIGVTVEASHVDLGATTSTTIVLGPFGDLVARHDGRWYLSWYPSARTAVTDGLEPPDVASVDEANSLVDDTVAGLAGVIPAVGALAGLPAAAHGGIVFSWGAHDIDRSDTELHERHDIGPHSVGDGYHSVDTGKLTTAPLFAVQLADRIAPTSA